MRFISPGWVFSDRRRIRAIRCSKCSDIARKKNLSVKAVSEDVRNFGLPKNRYSLIVAINLFQFLAKTDTQIVIDRAVAGLKRGGLFVCESFTIDDPHFKAHKKKSQEIAPGTFRDSSGNIYSLYNYGEVTKNGVRRTDWRAFRS